MVQHFRARLLDPLQYHSFVDVGASGGTVTAPFLGDLAIAFAINAAVLGKSLEERRGVSGTVASGPNYKEDIRTIGIATTVGVPDAPLKHMAPEFQGSSYMGEGFEQRRISSGARYNKAKPHRLYSPVGSSSWRPWRQAQLLGPGNEFRFSVLKGPNLPERFAFRMGTGRACLVEATRSEAPDRVTLNAWSAKNIHGVDAERLPWTRREYPLALYPLLHGIPTQAAVEAFA